jgi:hypothetical protein
MPPRRSSKPSKPSARRIRAGFRRVTVELSDATARNLKAYAAVRSVEFGQVVEDALKAHLRGFYVVDRTSDPTVETVRLADVTAEAVRAIVDDDDCPAHVVDVA